MLKIWVDCLKARVAYRFLFVYLFMYVLQNLPSEIEVKYKIAECYTILKLDKDAISVLDGIPSRQRTPKVFHHFL